MTVYSYLPLDPVQVVRWKDDMETYYNKYRKYIWPCFGITGALVLLWMAYVSSKNPSSSFRGDGSFQVLAVVGNGFRGYWFGQNLPRNASHFVPDTDVVVYFIHGGGFTSNNALSAYDFMHVLHDYLITNHGLNSSFFSLDYDLAPQTKFPIQRNQGLLAYEYISNLIHDPEKRLFVGGDSAGGNLALDILLNNDFPNPRGVFPISAWVDLSRDYQDNRNAGMDSLTANYMVSITNAYLPDDISNDLELRRTISPLYSLNETIAANIPSDVYSVWGGNELLADENREFVIRLEEARKTVVVDERPGQIHDWVHRVKARTPFERALVQDGCRRMVAWIANSLDK